MPKIILSRKGFDSHFGALPSIVLNGKMISFPIPFKKGTDYSELTVEQIKMNCVLKDFGFNDPKMLAHVDPLLMPELYGLDRNKGWLPAFGQHGSAQGHLNNQQVGPGDIFLFFGRFRNALKIDDIIRYEKGKDFHAIYGFMEIGEKYRIKDDLDKFNHFDYREHPHIKDRNATKKKNHIPLFNNNSSLYLPAKVSRYGFDATCGVFNFNEALILSDLSEKNITSWNFSPLKNKSFTYGLSLNKNGKGKSPNQGQEFVLKGDSSKVLEWVKEVVNSFTINIDQ